MQSRGGRSHSSPNLCGRHTPVQDKYGRSGHRLNQQRGAHPHPANISVCNTMQAVRRELDMLRETLQAQMRQLTEHELNYRGRVYRELGDGMERLEHRMERLEQREEQRERSRERERQERRAEQWYRRDYEDRHHGRDCRCRHCSRRE